MARLFSEVRCNSLVISSERPPNSASDLSTKRCFGRIRQLFVAEEISSSRVMRSLVAPLLEMTEEDLRRLNYYDSRQKRVVRAKLLQSGMGI